MNTTQDQTWVALEMTSYLSQTASRRLMTHRMLTSSNTIAEYYNIPASRAKPVNIPKATLTPALGAEPV